MKLLFVHQNMPGQYLHLVRYLASQPGHQIVFLTQRSDEVNIPGVTKIVYRPHRQPAAGIHHYLQDAEKHTLNAQAVYRAAMDLRSKGFVPDVMIGHNGWGEIWYLKDAFPSSPLLGYFEFFYNVHGADVGFDPEMGSITADTGPRIRNKNAGNLIGMDVADWGQCPTYWQRSRYPAHFQALLSVVHEGVMTHALKPDPEATLQIPGTDKVLKAGDEVVTYVARNLEPYRGFHQFMRSVPAILQKRPDAQIVIVGGDGVSYGAPLPKGQTYKQRMLDELGDSFDASRVHFVGQLPYATFIRMLQISRAHVYLTYPFVLSWSMLEAMSVGCLVIGSNTAPVKEVIEHGVNGMIVDFFQPSEIADRVVEALEDRHAHDAIRARARQTVVERYDLLKVCLPAQISLLTHVAGMRISAHAQTPGLPPPQARREEHAQ